MIYDGKKTTALVPFYQGKIAVLKLRSCTEAVVFHRKAKEQPTKPLRLNFIFFIHVDEWLQNINRYREDRGGIVFA